MTNPSYNPNEYVEPAVARNALVEHLKTLIPENTPRYMTAVQEIDRHLNDIVANETIIALTNRRLGELAMASTTFFGGTPAERGRQHLIAEGRAVDADKLPPAFRQRLAQTGVTDAEVLHVATQWYPQLSPKDALAKYTEVAAKTMADDATGVPVFNADGVIKGQTYGNAG